MTVDFRTSLYFHPEGDGVLIGMSDREEGPAYNTDVNWDFIARMFEELERRFGIDGPLDPRSLDHLLVRGLDVIEPERALPAPAREVPGPAGRVVQLSDHPVLAGTFGMK